MNYMYAKFDEEAHNGLVSILFISLFPYFSIVTLNFDLQNHKLISIFVSTVSLNFDLWPQINRVHRITMANMYAKFDEAHNNLISILFTSLFPYFILLWPWPLTSDL